MANKTETKKDRNICVVIEEILKIIPSTQIKRINEIKTYEAGLWNQPPENLTGSHCWVPFQNILSENITTFDEEWKQKLIKIFNRL